MRTFAPLPTVESAEVKLQQSAGADDHGQYLGHFYRSYLSPIKSAQHW